MRFIVLCQATEHSSRRLFFCLFSAQGRRDAPRSIQCISLPFPFHHHIVRKISISFLMIHQFIVFTDYTSLLISQSLQILSRNRTCFGTAPLLPISRSHQHRLQLRSQIFKNKPPHRFCSMNKCLHLSTICPSSFTQSIIQIQTYLYRLSKFRQRKLQSRSRYFGRSRHPVIGFVEFLLHRPIITFTDMFLDPCKAIIIPRQTICRTQIPQIGTVQGKAQGGIFFPYQRTYRGVSQWNAFIPTLCQSRKDQIIT